MNIQLDALKVDVYVHGARETDRQNGLQCITEMPHTCCSRVRRILQRDAADTSVSRLRLKCDDTRAENRFRLSAKRMSPFKSAGPSVQSTTSSRGVHISGSNAGYTMFLGSVKGTGYPLHSPVSPSLSPPCVTLCHHVSTGLYLQFIYLSLSLSLSLTHTHTHTHTHTLLNSVNRWNL